MPDSARLPRSSLMAYGAGIVAYQFPNNAFPALAMPLFNIALGIPAQAVGAVIMAGRLWDAVTNPIVGSVSDATRSRWGRRRPYLVAGAIATGIAYPIVWWVPRHWPQGDMIAYLFFATLLLFTAFSVYSVPYMALGFEMTPDVSERTRVQIWRSYFNLIPALAGSWLFWLCQRPWGGGVVAGSRWIGLFAGVVICLTGAIPGLALRERYYRLSAGRPKERAKIAYREALRNRPFVVILALIVTLIVGTQSTDALGIYVLSYYVYRGDPSAGAKLFGFGVTVGLLAGFALLPMLQAVESRIGKVGALKLCICLSVIADILKWFLISPARPWSWPLIVVFKQLGDIGFWAFVASMKADACDWDELQSGRRREGVYGAVAVVVQKCATSFVYLLAGVILSLIGFHAAAAAQAPGTILGLRLSFSLVPLVSLGLCLWLITRYSLTRPAMMRIRAELEARRFTV